MRFFNSVKALYTAVGILFLLFVLGGYLDFQNETMNSRHLQISIALERMIRLDQELTAMLALAAMEQNELRVTRYETVNQDVEAAIQKVIDLTKEQSMTQEISALREGHKKISDIEEIALQKMRAGSWKEGKDILFGDEYSIAKKTYEIDTETIPGVVLGEIEAIENRFNTIKSAALAARIGALCLLLWTGIIFSRRTRADLAEQVRLQKEISASNKLLEDRVQERTEELRLLLQSAGEGMFGVNTSGQTTFINPVALNLLGFGEAEMVGKDVHELIHHSHPDGSPYHKEYCPMNATCTSGTQNQVNDEVLWRKNGSSFPVEYSSTPIIKDGKVMGAVVTFRDITERKKARKELEERMEDLERFSRLTIDREEKMIQLKEEINNILEQTGGEKKYKIVA
ncbi:MAG: PAS domain S-box protein [Desulfobacteraceae bacterium]|nr:MAG: PAS domain S-box protein [Desulfobacteraceae bacterium]